MIWKECGELAKFKRTKIGKKYLNYGYVEFEEISGVYTCVRCINGLSLLEKTLTVRTENQVENLHDNWKKIKYKEYV